MDKERAEHEVPQLTRAAGVDKRIDPVHLLPEIEFVKDAESAGDIPSESLSIVHEGEQVGIVNMEFSRGAKEAWFNTVLIKKVEQGEGFGLAAYKAAIRESLERGYSFRTSPGLLTEAGKGIWERLAAVGVARVEREFVLDPLTDRYSGKYVVDAMEQPHHTLD